jgi:hypothetical protein
MRGSGAWALEVYGKSKEEDLLRETEEDILELDLDDEEEEMARKHLAMVVYYSQKSFNPKFLMADMLNAWGIQSMALVEKVGVTFSSLSFTSWRRRIESWREARGDIRETP